MSVSLGEVLDDPVDQVIEFFESLPQDEEIYMFSNTQCAVAKYFEYRTERETACGYDTIRYENDYVNEEVLPNTHWSVILQDSLPAYALPKEVVATLMGIKTIKLALNQE